MIFVQQIKSIYDFIVPIHTGAFVVSLVERPTIYMRRMGEFTLYAVYHWCDWSELPWPVRVLDEHKYDLEGVLVGPDWSAAVFHNTIKLVDRRVDRCFIEAAGHGIEFVQKWGGNWMYYAPGHYDIKDMDNPDVLSAMTRWQKHFNPQGVNMPWQWADGDMWNDPKKVKEKHG